MKPVRNDELAKFTESFIKSYLERGLGGYSGRELELLVLEFILLAYPELKDASVFEKSRKLKATESKIKNMLYEIKLKSTEDTQDFIENLEKNLKSAEYEKGKFIIEVDDVYAQKKVKSILKENGFISDSSFNSDMIKIPYEGLISVVEVVCKSKVGTNKYKDILATKRLIEANREILKSISIPGTKLNTISLWDMISSAAASIKSAITEKVSENKQKAEEKKAVSKEEK